MSERVQFWLGFIGGIIRIVGILMLAFTAYAALGVWGLGDSRGIPFRFIALALSPSVCILGRKIECVSQVSDNSLESGK